MFRVTFFSADHTGQSFAAPHDQEGIARLPELRFGPECLLLLSLGSMRQQPLWQADTMIAAVALQQGLELVTGNTAHHQ